MKLETIKNAIDKIFRPIDRLYEAAYKFGLNKLGGTGISGSILRTGVLVFGSLTAVSMMLLALTTFSPLAIVPGLATSVFPLSLTMTVLRGADKALSDNIKKEEKQAAAVCKIQPRADANPSNLSSASLKNSFGGNDNDASASRQPNTSRYIYEPNKPL